MKNGFKNKQVPSGNPLANVLVVIVGALAIGVSLVLGFVAFVALGSIIAVLAAVVGIRLWWFQRKLARAGHRRTGHQASSAGRDDVIEGEYRVVSRDNDGKRDRV